MLVQLLFGCLWTGVKNVLQSHSVGPMRPSKNQALINALATEIKLRRRELGFSQEDLAGYCQLDRPYIF